MEVTGQLLLLPLPFLTTRGGGGGGGEEGGINSSSSCSRNVIVEVVNK